MNIVISIVLMAAYLFVMIRRIGRIPDSLSASVFWLPGSYKVVWTLFILAICFLCVPTYIDKVSENTQFLAFLSIAGLGFVGAAPLVKWSDDHLQFNVHQYGAIVCALCSQLVIVFNLAWLLLCWVPFALVFVVRGWDKWRTQIFWAEMTCFGNTFIYCLI